MKLIKSLIFIFMFTIVSAQVTKVKYHMKYNAAQSVAPNKRFDFYIVITEGAAIGTFDRVLGGSQYTVIVPAGTIVDSMISCFPLQNNQNYTGTTPTFWNLSNQIFNPGAQPQSDFYGITNAISPSSFFNNTNLNDTIKLFSLDLELPSGSCLSGVRLFRNGVDPGSNALGMGGGDFSNGFVFGTSIGNPAQQDYNGNIQEYYPNEVVTNTNDSGPGSMRRAIECSASGYTVVFDDALVNDTIRLTNKVMITKEVKFNQAFNKIMKIKASNTATAFEITPLSILDIKNVHVIGGNSSSLVGRTFVNNGTLSLDGVTIKDKFIGTTNSGSTIKNNKTLILKSNSFIKKL